jgi:hypothetical protein
MPRPTSVARPGRATRLYGTLAATRAWASAQFCPSIPKSLPSDSLMHPQVSGTHVLALDGNLRLCGFGRKVGFSVPP